MRVLIDTSIWVDHFKRRNDILINLLENDLVLTHPMILVEIACGTPPAPRKQTLDNIKLLQSANQAGFSEVMDFIENEKLYGSGCGLVDITLLASTLITPGSKLWTGDRRLVKLTGRFGVEYLQL